MFYISVRNCSDFDKNMLSKSSSFSVSLTNKSKLEMLDKTGLCFEKQLHIWLKEKIDHCFVVQGLAGSVTVCYCFPVR